MADGRCRFERPPDGPRQFGRLGDGRVIDIDPASTERFVVVVDLGIPGGQHKEPNVEVQVLRLVAAGRNGVHIDIDSRCDDPQAIDTGLLCRLFERNGCQIAITVSVAAWLKPSAELCVMQQQGLSPNRIDDECRAGQVPIEACSMQRIGVCGTEFENLIPCDLGVRVVEIGGSQLLHRELQVIGSADQLIAARFEDGEGHAAAYRSPEPGLNATVGYGRLTCLLSVTAKRQ